MDERSDRPRPRRVAAKRLARAPPRWRSRPTKGAVRGRRAVRAALGRVAAETPAGPRRPSAGPRARGGAGPRRGRRGRRARRARATAGRAGRRAACDQDLERLAVRTAAGRSAPGRASRRRCTSRSPARAAGRPPARAPCRRPCRRPVAARCWSRSTVRARSTGRSRAGPRAPRRVTITLDGLMSRCSLPRRAAETSTSAICRSAALEPHQVRQPDRRRERQEPRRRRRDRQVGAAVVIA